MVASENVKKCSLAIAPESLNDVVLICSLLIRNEFYLLHVCSSVVIIYIKHVLLGKEYIVFTFFFIVVLGRPMTTLLDLARGKSRTQTPEENEGQSVEEVSQKQSEHIQPIQEEPAQASRPVREELAQASRPVREELARSPGPPKEVSSKKKTILDWP